MEIDPSIKVINATIDLINERLKVDVNTRRTLPIHSIINLLFKNKIEDHKTDFSLKKIKELAKNIKAISEEKISYYQESRFGFIKEFFSKLRNLLQLGKYASSAALGMELSQNLTESIQSRNNVIRSNFLDSTHSNEKLEKDEIEEDDSSFLKRDLSRSNSSGTISSIDDNDEVNNKVEDDQHASFLAYLKANSIEQGYLDGQCSEILRPIDGKIEENEWQGQHNAQRKNGYFNGSAKITLKDGRILEGSFKNSALEGQGTVEVPGKQKLEGNFKAGLLNEGKITSDISICEGIFHNNQLRQGKSHVFFKDYDSTEEGDFEKGWLMKGQQVFNDKRSGSVHRIAKGIFDYGHLKNGTLSLLDANDKIYRIYQGNFNIIGQLHGNGQIILYTSKGEIKKIGQFDSDKLIKGQIIYPDGRIERINL